MYQSLATVDSPEFINIEPYNPLISKCEIKVLYVGKNRNRSYITKETAKKMANSLPGSPIVGYYKEDKEDFSDHGQRVIIDDEGVKFEKLTKPYGFVAPDATVWFQTFEDTDEFGNKTIREYLMTNGYLWAGQFPEVKRVLEHGNNQSMELDSETLDGKWAMDHNEGIEFFIINDAIFSQLAILGEDVEPCFEGATISRPHVSKDFTLMDKEFTHTLFSMMRDLQSALESREGGSDMAKETLETSEDNLIDHALETEELVAEEEVSTEEKKTEEALVEESSSEEFSAEETEVETAKEEYAAQEEEAEELTAEKFALLQGELEEVKTKFADLEAEAEGLREFKNNIEDSRKDELIKSFYMLSDEDKEDVIKNKSEYSLDEIEAKLAVIAVRKKVSFDNGEEKEEGEPVVTFNLDSINDSVPAFVKALRNVKTND